ncbi:MAG: YdcF family protein [Acidobacteriia bacterium]|nr:YdcF family protein [Terriglobia bacterium]
MRRGEHGGIFFRLLALLVVLALLAFLYILRHPLMRLAGQLWVVNEPAVQADVILVLGDDNYAGDRAAHAAELYRAGLAPQVVASGRLLRPYAGIAEMIEHDLESHGVPAASIVKFSHRAANTREEAEALGGLVASRGWRRVLVVTSDYHARRARFIFDHVFPPGVIVRVSAAHDTEFDPSHWWETRLGQKLLLNEVLGYVVARWELRHRSPAAAGATLLFSMSLPACS